MDPKALQEAADAFVDAALEPELWPKVLQQLADAAGATGLLLVPVSARVQGLPITDSLGELAESYFKDGWYIGDKRAQVGAPIAIRKGIVVDADIIDTETMKRDPYYQELLRPHGFEWFAAVAFRAEDDVFGASFQRTIAQGPYTPEEQQHLLRISGRLTTAATLARKLAAAAVDGMVKAFETAGSPLLLANRAGKIVGANARAEPYVHDPLHVLNGDMMLSSAAERSSLDLHILSAVRGGPPLDGAPRDFATVSRPGRRPLYLRAVPAPRRLTNYFSPAATVILIIDPESTPRSHVVTIQRLFALTPAEARLALAIADGKSPEVCAAELSLTLPSLRQLTKQVMAKTETHRQAELVALIARCRLAWAGNEG